MIIYLKSDLDLAAELFKVLHSKHFHDVVIHCQDGKVGANASLLAAGSPFWASLLKASKGDEGAYQVLLLEESTAKVKKYILSLLHFNRKVSNEKVYRVNEDSVKPINTFQPSLQDLLLLQKYSMSPSLPVVKLKLLSRQMVTNHTKPTKKRSRPFEISSVEPELQAKRPLRVTRSFVNDKDEEVPSAGDDSDYAPSLPDVQDDNQDSDDPKPSETELERKRQRQRRRTR